MQEHRGCEKPVKAFKQLSLLADPKAEKGSDAFWGRIDRCPLKLLTGVSRLALIAYRNYKAGYLPVRGGWLDQSQWFISAMGVIEGTVNEINAEKIKDMKRGK